MVKYLNKLYYLVNPFNAQVLSESMSKALLLICGENASETAKFVGMADKFFDALNIHNYMHGVRKLKLFQAPYTSSEDMRLKVGGTFRQLQIPCALALFH